MAKKDQIEKKDAAPAPVAFDGKAHEGKGSTKFFQGKSEVAPAEERSKPAYVISRQDHPVTLSYNGECIIIPPRGRELVANYQLLGALPKGISVVPKI